MGQKGSKEASDGGSNLVEALVIDYPPPGGADDLQDARSAPSGGGGRPRSMDLKASQPKSDHFNGDNPAPRRQNLFQEELEVVGGGNEKGKKRDKKPKEKKTSTKRKTPRRRRSARVAPTVLTDPGVADPGEGETSDEGDSPEVETFPKAWSGSGQQAVCIEVDDDTNEPSMESETESLNMKPVSDSEIEAVDIKPACDSESDSGANNPGSTSRDIHSSTFNGQGAQGGSNGFVNNGISDGDDESCHSELGAARVTIGGISSHTDHSPGKPPEENVDETYMSPMQLYNAMNDGQLSPYLFDPTYILIIDTRDAAFYHLSHIVTAFHVSDLKVPGKIGRLEEYTIIMLYDTNGLTYSLTDSLMTSIMTDLTTSNLDPFILKGGYDAFYENYPFLCCDKVVRTERQRQKLLLQYPSEILPGQLYLGRGDQATNEVIVTNLGITHIVNITTEHPDAFPERIEYLTIKAEDEPTSDMHGVLLDVIKFTGDALLAGSKVLVHCNLGRSRSATAVMAYLIATRRWTLRDAYVYVKERRPIVGPNRGFCKQLAKFEKEILGDSITDPDELWMGR